MDSKFCMYCNMHYNNIVDHCINICAYLEMEKSNLWLEILEISIQAYIFLCNTDGSRVPGAWKLQSLLESWAIKMSNLK